MSQRLVTSSDDARIEACPAEINPQRLPAHVAVIMDGNGRWAQSRGLPRVMGHRAGVEALKTTLRRCSDWGVKALTAYAFSTENWSRPGDEVNFLMTLFERVLERELQALESERVRIRLLGDTEPVQARPPSSNVATTRRAASTRGWRRGKRSARGATKPRRRGGKKTKPEKSLLRR